MSNLSVFNFNSNEVRTIDRDNQIWFVAADVCKALNLSNTTKALLSLDEDEQALTTIQGLTRGNDSVNIINESGLYSLVLRSRKAEAKVFKKWVTSEVLPTIRKTGSYTLTINPQQQRAIQEAVNDSVHRVAGRTHQGVYSSIKTKYGIAKYDQLPASQFDDCISWLNDGFTKPKVLELDEELKSAIYDVCYHAIENNANYAKLLRALRVFHEDSANYDLRHAREGSIAAVHLSQLLDLRNKLNKPLMSSPNILNCYGGNSIHYAISVF